MVSVEVTDDVSMISFLGKTEEAFTPISSFEVRLEGRSGHAHTDYRHCDSAQVRFRGVWPRRKYLSSCLILAAMSE